MKILDMSAGKRNIWLNRLYPDAVYIDIRPEMFPSVIADTRALPFPNGFFSLVVFDPPHMVHGLGSVMASYYGHFSGEEIKELIRESSKEAFRVSKDGSLMLFKWNNHDVRLDHVLPLMEGYEPLLGHNFKSGKRSTTSWVTLRKRGIGYSDGRILNV